MEQSQIEYSHTRNSQGYFMSVCDISIPLSSITLGILNVTAQIFPNGTNSSYGLSSNNYIPIEPPDIPPVILINQQPTTNTTVTIQEGDNITLSCRIVGGNPNTGNISLTCGFNSSVSEGNLVHLVLGKVFRERNGEIYKAMVTSFSIIGSNKTTIEVKNESVVAFQCEADGNPKPVITIGNERKVYATDSGMLSTLMACEDGGDYFCKATNGFPTDQEPQHKYNTTVYVFCPPQLKTKDVQLDVYYEAKGNNFSKHLLLFGYPAPEIFVIYKLNATTKLNAVIPLNKYDDLNMMSSNGNRISLLFSYQDIPYGDLHIAVNSLIATDFTSYKIYISNNVTRNLLEYSFEIKEIEENSNDVIAASVGGTLAAVVLIVVCILAIVQRRNILDKIQTIV
ncbi:uncharacterized protein LOC131958391 [Physella acuta]|uniref:uncharacterized protein LOC131958391 n=1 Tax=Physella acuta TaxID=109671 RepID=UPI0027DD746B|nr:uncharacterized protein LOC131958391 [Physella acuta]